MKVSIGELVALIAPRDKDAPTQHHFAPDFDDLDPGSPPLEQEAWQHCDERKSDSQRLKVFTGARLRSVLAF
jgi:hypothetical protein